MKGISPMIATVLLIAFTVAVGGILAVWFSTYTKTQTSSVSKSSSCATILADVKALSYSDSSKQLVFMVTNPGSQGITINSIVVNCNNTEVGTNATNKKIPASSQTTITLDVSSDLDHDISGCLSGDYKNKIGISITYTCDNGGTNSAECPVGTCFS